MLFTHQCPIVHIGLTQILSEANLFDLHWSDKTHKIFELLQFWLPWSTSNLCDRPLVVLAQLLGSQALKRFSSTTTSNMLLKTSLTKICIMLLQRHTLLWRTSNLLTMSKEWYNYRLVFSFISLWLRRNKAIIYVIKWFLLFLAIFHRARWLVRLGRGWVRWGGEKEKRPQLNINH